MRWPPPGAGADMIGLNFYEQSPRQISLATAAEISRALPPLVLRVGVFVNPAEALVMRAISECNLSLLQFHGDETSEFCTQFGLMSLKAFRIRDEESLNQLANYHTNALSARCPFQKWTWRHGRKIQLGAGGGGTEIWQAHLPRGWIDAGKCGGCREKSPALCRGCLQWRGICARKKRCGESRRVHSSGSQCRRSVRKRSKRQK